MTLNSPSRAPTLLGLVAQHWEPGKVKPQLAATIGESHAATLHALCVAAAAERFSAIGDARVLAFAPTAAQQAFACVARGKWQLQPQASGESGQGLEPLLTEALGRAEKVVLVGTDCPDLPATFIEQAFHELDEHDVVLGPNQNGGCSLLGVARRVPPIFTGIAWGAPALFSSLVERLKSAGIAWRELPLWQEVAAEADVAALLQRISRQGFVDPALRNLEAQILALLHNCRVPRRSRAG